MNARNLCIFSSDGVFGNHSINGSESTCESGTFVKDFTWNRVLDLIYLVYSVEARAVTHPNFWEEFMSEPFLGEIRMFSGNFAPTGWALCDGQLLSIAQNTALFSILGTTFGGDGTSTFALPDLRGRVAIHWGQGPGLSPYNEGQSGGSEVITLTHQQIAAHTHAVNVETRNKGSSAHPNGQFLASTGGSSIYAPQTDGTTMNAGVIGSSGGGQPHSNIQPYLSVSFIIALLGIFPSRN